MPAALGAYEPGSPERLEWLEQRRASWALEDRRELVEGDEEDGEAGATEGRDGAGELEAEQRSVAPR